jgi:hypothetical protein
MSSPISKPASKPQLWFGIFRLAVWPNLFSGVQFSQKPEALEQFFRAMVPNTGPFDVEVNVAAVSALFDKIGPGILITHSQAGGPGRRTTPRRIAGYGLRTCRLSAPDALAKAYRGARGADASKSA